MFISVFLNDFFITAKKHVTLIKQKKKLKKKKYLRPTKYLFGN